jgi:hypothetical protein
MALAESTVASYPGLNSLIQLADAPMAGSVSTMSVTSPTSVFGGHRGHRPTQVRGPPPTRWNSQTLTQMEHMFPRPRDVDAEDEDLSRGVIAVIDASGKKIYRLKVGNKIGWFLDRSELEGKPPASCKKTVVESDSNDTDEMSVNLLQPDERRNRATVDPVWHGTSNFVDTRSTVSQVTPESRLPVGETGPIPHQPFSQLTQ